MTKSLTSFIRKSLDVKGKTEHTGRGSWWLHRQNKELTYKQVADKVNELLPSWKQKDLVEQVCVDKQSIQITFNKQVFDTNYRVFYINKEMYKRTKVKFTLLCIIGFIS